MFAYNVLSDLKNSDELVTPLRKEGNSVICLTTSGTEKSYAFSDFDFSKTVADRAIAVTTMEELLAQMLADEKEQKEELQSFTIGDMAVSASMHNAFAYIISNDSDETDTAKMLKLFGYKATKGANHVSMDTAFSLDIKS